MFMFLNDYFKKEKKDISPEMNVLLQLFKPHSFIDLYYQVYSETPKSLPFAQIFFLFLYLNLCFLLPTHHLNLRNL